MVKSLTLTNSYFRPSTKGFLLLFKSEDKKEKEWIYNNQDGKWPTIIVSKNGKLLNYANKFKPKPFLKLQEGRRYFTKMTKRRARYLAKHPNISKQMFEEVKASYGFTTKELFFRRYLNIYNKGKAVTLLEHGKSITKYQSPQLRR